MKKKIVIALIAAAIVLAAIAACVYVANKDVADAAVIAVIDTGMQEGQQDEGGNAAATQEETEEVFEIAELTGTITEITDEYVLLDAGEMGMIQANTSMDTLIEGVEELMVGQTAVILYDGKMTRSLPAQITALKIGVYEVKGTVTEIAEGRITIARTDGGDEVVLTLPQDAAEIAVGDAITAYTTGVSTMSLPPQMNAIAIIK